MRAYETLYITRPDAAEDRVSKVQDKVSKTVKSHEGSVLGFDDWGTRKLAYEIRRNGRGRMVVVGYCAQPAVVADVERELRLDDVVMRYTTRLLGDGADTGARKKEFEARAEKAKAGSDEEERESRERSAPPAASGPSGSSGASRDAGREAPSASGGSADRDESRSEASASKPADEEEK